MKMKTILLAALSAGMVALAPATAMAQTQPASTLGELLQRIQRDSSVASQEARERLAQFEADRASQRAELDRARAQLQQARAAEQENLRLLEENRQAILAKQAELNEEQGELGELFGIARQAAGRLKGVIDTSIISGEMPNRTGPLQTVAESDVLPTIDQLQAVWRVPAGELIAQTKVKTFTTDVEKLGSTEVTRVGPFLAWAEGGKFLEFNDEAQTFTPIPRAPAAKLVSAAKRVTNASPDTIVAGPVDPTRGGFLEVLKRTPGTFERIDQGGIIGYVIVYGILPLGVLFGVLKFLSLLMTRSSMSGQARRLDNPKSGNPLGRVLLAAREGGNDLEEVELKLDAQIIKETGRLERGMSFLKLGAAIAPLLGLLGTVTGMIKVFTAITIYGAGDPAKMAGGISEALVTTMLGLIAAVPLLVIHALCYSAQRSAQQLLEEQASGMVARVASGSRA